MKFINEYTKYAQKLTDSPIHFHRFVAYSIIGAALKNKVFFRFGDIKIFPNLWLVLLAPSSTFRKSTSINIGMGLLRRACPSIQYPAEFSHEKILEVLQEQPQGIFVFYEFLSLIGLLSRDYMAGTKALFTELFDSPDYYERKTKGVNVLIEEPVISILSATTMQWFLEKVKESDLLGGFLPRFLFIPATIKLQEIALPPPADRNEKIKLIKMLVDISNEKDPIEMTLSEEAKKLYENWYRKYTNKVDNSRMAFLSGRLNVYLIKFAMIVEMGEDGGTIIKKESMEEAITNINWIENNMGILMDNEVSFSKGEAQKKKVLKSIREFKEKGITRSELLRKTHLFSNFLNQVLQTLLEDESIDIKSQQENGDDKPTTRYFIRNSHNI